MIKIPHFYSQNKLIAAFEFGINVAASIKGKELEEAKKIVERAENILINELSKKSYERFVLDTIPNILAAVEPK